MPAIATLAGTAGLVLGCVAPAMAQQPVRDTLGVIAGRVIDASTAEPRTGASVALVGTGRGAIADSAGRFVIPGVLPGSVTVRARLFGYRPIDRALMVRAGDTTRVEFALEPEAAVLGAVRTEARPIERDAFDTRPSVGTVSITARGAEGVPRVGEADVLRMVQLLPGVEARNDFSTGLNVRGGESDQNLILLDGYPIYNPFHLGGLFSTFIEPTVGGVTLMTGGFPARYGGRLSSVLDVASADETRSGVHGGADLSVLASTAALGGAVASGRMSWMVAGRRTYADRFVDLISDQELPYHFRDEQARIRVALSPATTLTVTAYDGADALDANIASFGDSTEANASGGTFRFDWGNRLIGATLSGVVAPRGRTGLAHWLLGDSTRLTQRASLSTFSTMLDLGAGSLTLRNEVADRRLSGEISTHTGRHERTIGYEAASYRIDYDALSSQAGTGLFALHQAPLSGGLYVDDLWRASSRWLLETGLRAEALTDRGWLGLSPRVSTKLFVTRDWALTGAVGRFTQWTHSLAREDIPVRLFDFWVASDSVTPVSTAWHYILGSEWWFGASRYARIEGFYKDYKDLLEANPQDDPATRGDEFLVADGVSYGADLLLRQLEHGRFSGWISYTYAMASRVQDGTRYFPGHDRRHDLDVVARWRFARYLIGLHYGYATGTPYTDIVAQVIRRVYDPELNLYGTRGSGRQMEFVGGTRNGARLPSTQRLDLDVTGSYQWGGATISPFVSVVNASDARNVFIYIFDYSKSPPTRQAISQFPLLPSAGVTIRF